MTRLLHPAKRCLVCGRRIGVRRRPIIVEGGDAIHQECGLEYAAEAQRTSASALADWRALASAFERGETVSTDELTIALVSRDFLEEERQRLPPDRSAQIVRELARIDAEYRAVTRPDSDGVLATVWPHGPGWWWMRLPARGENAEYFRGEAEQLRHGEP